MGAYLLKRASGRDTPMRPVSLNERQTEVLRWIADGAPSGVMTGYAHRISAASLRARGLIRTVGRGPTWTAVLTEAGRELLTQYENEPTTTKTPTRRASGSGAAETARGQNFGRRDATLRTEQLVTDVVAAGGSLQLPDETHRGGINWRQRAYAAQRCGKVPAGKHLRVSRSSNGFLIELLDGECERICLATPGLRTARISGAECPKSMLESIGPPVIEVDAGSAHGL